MLGNLLTLLEAAARADSPPRAFKRSDLFANEELTNQFGQKFRFKDDLVTDRAVILSTMYTICNGTCPGTNAMLQRIREPLGKVFGKRVSILSITIDPENDTPEVLREYASYHDAGDPAKADQCDWHFLTASPETIERLRISIGFYDLDPKIDADPTEHAALLYFGNDRTDRWAGAPTGLRDGLIFASLRRTLGETTKERFGINV